MITKERLDEIKVLEQATTPGPWERGEGAAYMQVIYFGGETGWEGGDLVAEANLKADDADFIAASRSIVPELVAEVEVQSKVINVLLKYLSTLDEGPKDTCFECQNVADQFCQKCWCEWAEKESGK